MSQSETPRLKLPLLAAGQAGKHVTLNEAMLEIDLLAQIAIISTTLSVPPANPLEGDSYLVADAPTGAWAGHARALATLRDGQWLFRTAARGWIAFAAAENRTLVFDGSAWRDLPVVMDRTAKLGVNMDASSTNRLAVSGDASLFSHAGNSHRLNLNKNTTADTASLVFQNNYSGRAEIGLTGDDRLHVKTSPNGASWTDAVIVDGNGNVGINTTPAARLSVQGGQAHFGWSVLSADAANGAPALKLMSLGTGDRYAYIDCYACDAYADYSSRFIRFPGTDGIFSIYNRGTGGIELFNEQGGATRIFTGGTVRFTVAASGNVGIGTTAPTAPLHVTGAARVGQFAKASLPSASTMGAGSMIHVTDEAGGAVIAFSDGTAWRRVTDRAVVA
jgi:Protein of unknown function (DUF2793)